MKHRVTVALFALLVMTTALARAQMSEGEKKAAARAAYMEGVALQDKGQPAEALDRFEAAQSLYDAPTHLLHIAECQALTGKLVDASETYQTLIREPLEKDAPSAFVAAQEQAKAELAQLRPRIPTLRVNIKPDPETLQDLRIDINDRQMPAELAGIARPVNPGKYTLSATATGLATAAPVDVEVNEKEAKTVELTLQQGGVAGAVTGAPGPDGGAPPPYEQPKEPASPQSPSSAGLLVGARLGYFLPAGDVVKNVKFGDLTSAGPGFGLDLMGRLGRIFLVGGTLEYAALGPPDASAIPTGRTARVSANTVYAGVLAGIMPNVDRVTFIADAGLGLRFLSHEATISGGGQPLRSDQTFSGIELALNAGISIPAGPIRIVPKAGLSYGQFSSRNCGLTSQEFTGCASNAAINTAGHVFLNAAIGLYYHFDFAKKKKTASASAPPPPR